MVVYVETDSEFLFIIKMLASDIVTAVCFTFAKKRAPSKFATIRLINSHFFSKTGQLYELGSITCRQYYLVKDTHERILDQII